MNQINLDKPFLTYEKLIQKLENKKLSFTDKYDKEYTIKLLKDNGYFSLVCGYKDMFKSKKTNDYIAGVNIHDIYSLFLFDDNMRSILFKYILIAERKIKSLYSYAFVETFDELQTTYLDTTKYDYINADAKKINGINELVQILTKLITPPFDKNYLRHQYKKHHNIPMWVVIKALSLGNVSKMYSFSTNAVKTKISKEFVLSEGELVSVFELISKFRNICAHNERLYDYKVKKSSYICDTSVHRVLNIKKKKNEYIQGKRDLFALLICLKFLIDNKNFEQMIDKIDNLIEELLNSSKKVQRSNLLKTMGFPENWKTIKTIKI